MWDVAFGVKNDSFEHEFAALVDDIATGVDQVAACVNPAALVVNRVTVAIALEDGVAERVEVEFSLDLLDVEFGVGEDLGELSILEVLGKPEYTLIGWIDNVAVAIDGVTLLIDTVSCVVLKMAVFVLDWHDVSILVFAHDAHYILDVETLALVIVELGHGTVSKELFAIKLLAAELVNKVASSATLQPAVFVHSAALLIDEEALLGLEEAREELGSIRLRLLLVRSTLTAFAASRCRAIISRVNPIKVTHQTVRIARTLR